MIIKDKNGKPLISYTLEEMDDILAEAGSFRGCGRLTGIHYGTWIRYYREKLEEKEQMRGLKQTMLTLDNSIDTSSIKFSSKENISAIIERTKMLTKSASSKLFFNPDEMRIGLFDIESTGLVGDFGCILCMVIKTFGSREKGQVFKVDLDRRDLLEAEKEMLVEAIKVLESYQGLAGYYSTRFDMPMIRTRCMFHGIPAPKKIKHFDAYFTIRRTVNPTTRRMDRINEINRITDQTLPEKSRLGLAEWTGAMFRRDKQCLDYIVDHCEKDVDVLESIINKYIDFVPDRIMRS